MATEIYLDNSATTPVFSDVLEAMQQTMIRYYANPSSLHRLGTQAHQLMDSARQQIAELLGCDAQDIFFTSGGTESDNWAIKGTAIEKKGRGRHLITTTIEHPAVHETFEYLKKQGFKTTYIPVNSEGVVSVSDIEKAITSETTLVSVMAVNNEVGSVQPIAEIGEMLSHYPNIHFHVDGVQSVGKFPTPLIHPRVDMMSFSAHKFNGPRGVGILYKKHQRTITPLLHGGGQESHQRSTTENLAGIVGTAKALRLSLEHAKEENQRHHWFQQKIRQVLAPYSNSIRIFSPENGAPHVLCLALKGVRGEVMVHALEERNIYVSTTSACSSRATHTASSTLRAMGVDGKWAQNAIRVSFGYQNTEQDIERFIQSYLKLIEKFKKIQ